MTGPVPSSTGTTVLAAALSALVVMLGAYFSFIRNVPTRDEMQTYVQTQSPFAHKEPLFEHMAATLAALQRTSDGLLLANQRAMDQIAELRRDLRREEAAERRRRH